MVKGELWFKTMSKPLMNALTPVAHAHSLAYLGNLTPDPVQP